MGKTIFLTFDDGIQNGTAEVLKVLDELNVIGTFFLTGIHIEYYYEKDPIGCLQILREVIKKHSWGNHSYSHANDLYYEYYNNGGVQLDNKNNRCSVIEDFIKNEQLVKHFFQLAINGQNSIDTFLEPVWDKVARLPGRNTWAYESSGKLNFLGEDDALNAAKNLCDIGYMLFGWNVEWMMSFDFYKHTINIKKELRETGVFNFENKKHRYPDIDMSLRAFNNYDRPIENWMAVAQRILKLPKDNVVVLMHDRAFRSFEHDIIKDDPNTNNTGSATLKQLIKYLKIKGCDFKGLFSYPKN